MLHEPEAPHDARQPMAADSVQRYAAIILERWPSHNRVGAAPPRLRLPNLFAPSGIILIEGSDLQVARSEGNMDEAEAISRLKGGDIVGLETLVRVYQGRALRTAYLITRDTQLAEDVTIDAFLRAYERIRQYDTERPFGPWFLRIVVNLARRRATQYARDLAMPDEDLAGENIVESTLASAQVGPHEAAERAELRAAVWDALGRLTPAQRATVVQRYYLDLSEREIAARLDCSVGTVKWRLHTARQRLARWLRPLWEGGTR